MAITCCKGCMPPDRTPTCHFDGSCDKYPEQKAKHDAELDQANKVKMTSFNLTNQTGERVAKANKRKKIK